jgi:DtxR family Mn-dependent transcriptional regulator
VRHNSQDYLLAVWELIESYGSANEKGVSERLGISLPSAWEGIHRLEREQQLRILKKGLAFTREGYVNALKVTNAHRISEYFAYSYLEVPWDEVHNSVMNLEHDFSDRLLSNLYKKMGSPAYCPHGNPINPSQKMLEVSAFEAEEGKYYFVRPVLEKYDFLKQLLNSGSTPGKMVVLEKNGGKIYLEGESGEIKIPAELERTVRLRQASKEGATEAIPTIKGSALFSLNHVSQLQNFNEPQN